MTGIEGKRLLNASLKSVEQTDQDDQSADIDNLGNFQFMDVENGGYDLMIVADDISFLLRGITVSAFNV